VTTEYIDGPPTITLDTAQGVVIAALEGRLEYIADRIGFGWTMIEDVGDSGADRFERCVAFDLALPDGTRKTFVATITEEEA
jgi:hypothetical protein